MTADTLDLLLPNGVMKLKSYSELSSIPWNHFRMWCHFNARYGIPTIELVDWLKSAINGRSTIEIGSGHGDFAYHLGIKATDSWVQQTNDVAKEFYAVTKQPTVQYPDWVEKLEATEAVNKYKPEVVIASWVTHWVTPNRRPKNDVGSIFGVKEAQLLKRGIEYIFIGNLGPHEFKPIRDLPHEEINLPFLISRAADQTKNRIMIWKP